MKGKINISCLTVDSESLQTHQDTMKLLNELMENTYVRHQRSWHHGQIEANSKEKEK